MLYRDVSITKCIAFGDSVKTVYQLQVCIVMYVIQPRIMVTCVSATIVYSALPIMIMYKGVSDMCV